MAAAASMDFGPIYQAAGKEWNVDPNLIAAVAGQEGGGISNVSPKGAQGHMQIMPRTQQDLGVANPNDPVQSIYGGAKYLSQLLDRYQDQPDPVSAAVGAYNAGPGRMDDYIAGKGGLPAETVAYIPGVASRYQAITGGSGQQPAQPQIAPPAPAAPSLDDTATASLDSTMARLRGGGQSVTPANSNSVVTAPPPAAPQAPGAPVDYFSMAKAAALGAPGGATPPAAPQSAPPPAQAPAGSQSGAPGAGVPVDWFSMAKAAALAAPGAPAPTGGAVTPVSMPGAAQPAPNAPPPALGSGVMGTIGTIANAAGQQAANFAEGAGHAALERRAFIQTHTRPHRRSCCTRRM